LIIFYEKKRMAMAQATVTLNDIRRVVQQIVERFDPQKVILFGSYASGRPTKDSDVDLLVVMDTDEEPIHAAARIAAAIDHPFAVVCFLAQQCAENI
jgi:predicted nucleotidyltransferase